VNCSASGNFKSISCGKQCSYIVSSCLILEIQYMVVRSSLSEFYACIHEKVPEIISNVYLIDLQPCGL